MKKISQRFLFVLFCVIVLASSVVVAFGADSAESATNQSVDYSEWYAIVADTMGVSVTTLMESADSIATIAGTEAMTVKQTLNQTLQNETLSPLVYETGAIDYYLGMNLLNAQVSHFINTPPAQLMTDVATQQSLWEEWQINNYRYQYENYNCECLPSFLEVTVKNDSADTVVLLPPSYPRELTSYDYRTIDDFFAIATTAASDPLLTHIIYDPLFGYPVEIELQSPADQNVSYRLSHFTPAPISDIQHSIDYSAWYEVAANVLGISSTELSMITPSLSTVAMSQTADIEATILTTVLSELASISDAPLSPQSSELILNQIAHFLNTPMPSQSDVITQQQLWSNWNIANYQFSFTEYCFCMPIGDVTVSVTDTVAVTISVTMIDPNYAPYLTNYVRNIPDFFSTIASAEATPAAMLHVTYDPIFGYPRTINIDYYRMMADDEVYYTLFKLHPTTVNNAVDMVYDFEQDNLDGWSYSGDAVSMTISTAQAQDGSQQSLAVDLMLDAEPVTVTLSTTISEPSQVELSIYVPVGGIDVTLMGETHSITTEGWQLLSWQLLDAYIDALPFEISSAQPYSGTIYLDQVKLRSLDKPVVAPSSVTVSNEQATSTQTALLLVVPALFGMLLVTVAVGYSRRD